MIYFNNRPHPILILLALIWKKFEIYFNLFRQDSKYKCGGLDP